MACKPRQISGNDPLAAIPKDYNRYCDKIIGNAGGLFLDPDVLARAEQIIADGGTVEDIIFWDSFVKYAKYNTIMPFWADIVAAYSPSWGVKGTTTASKLYSIISAAGDIDQVVGANQPTITANDVNGRTSLITDGINDLIQGDFTYGTPETIVLMGYKLKTWVVSQLILDGKIGSLAIKSIQQTTATPTVSANVGGGVGAANSDLTIGVAAHFRALFNNPAVNGLKVQVDGNAETQGTSAAVSDMDGFTFGAAGNGILPSHESVGVIVCLDMPVDGNYTAKAAALRAFGQGAYATP